MIATGKRITGGFQPIEITLVAQTEQEATALYSILNSATILNAAEKAFGLDREFSPWRAFDGLGVRCHTSKLSQVLREDYNTQI